MLDEKKGPAEKAGQDPCGAGGGVIKRLCRDGCCYGGVV
ncbi:hypothetical protein VVNSV5830_01884 [Vibrio vulnificus]|nr:hypothetical protein VVORL1506_00401 [Vibrio vulnificus]OJI26622.1 hypothetical protein VVNSV5830_01884 [Vibrio vulnificus]